MRKLPAVLSTSVLALILGVNTYQVEMLTRSQTSAPSHPLLTQDSEQQSEHRGSGRAESLGLSYPATTWGGV